MTSLSVGRRSWLFTPATKPERFDRAAEAGADALIVDLEDAVASADKETARDAALDWLTRPGVEGGVLRALRINPPGTAFGLEDLLGLVRSGARPDAVVLPKTESADVLQLVDRLFVEAGKPIRLVALIESARGVAEAAAIARATTRLDALFFGAADLAADLGAEIAWEPLLHARSCVVNAAAQAGLATIDSPFFAIADEDGLRRETAAAARMGFTAKAAIHPRQIAAINAALTPTAEQIAEARLILAENAKGVGVVGGRMIDEAIARKARRVLAAAGEAVSQ
ncbi:itaconate degradation C-C-lyase RipC [Azospirillum doebereinerae]|uniref:CoA ester lyase n=1 Tax=Azospirillum doebereinerae TaxID=92933 RepID=A0A433J3N6_9PROT|nr:itaconate degradation C-C-lyase RipC [Azospirillum doebereinerae]MCG5241279.1 itaconate degradation C-C-lyase RipC [Azospirillum doebereinerae]RUQ66402.1 CoA ester lyase [Azospirillum doebereinerae]